MTLLANTERATDVCSNGGGARPQDWLVSG